jgi:hypothetical protein
VEGAERERYALLSRGFTLLFGTSITTQVPKEGVGLVLIFLRFGFGFVVEGMRDGTSFGIKEMK